MNKGAPIAAKRMRVDIKIQNLVSKMKISRYVGASLHCHRQMNDVQHMPVPNNILHNHCKSRYEVS